MLSLFGVGLPNQFGLVYGLTAPDSTPAQLCEELEFVMGRPVIDETGVNELYDFRVSARAGTLDALIAALREQCGLVVTPGRREVDVLAVKPGWRARGPASRS
jgi:uncharacterized protein (TIGR03435 family)